MSSVCVLHPTSSRAERRLPPAGFCFLPGNRPASLSFPFLFHNLAELESENELTSPCLLPDPAFVPVSLSLLFLLSIFTLNTEVVSQVCVELHDERLSLKH